MYLNSNHSQQDICSLSVKIEFIKFRLKVAGNIFSRGNTGKIALFTLDRRKLSAKETWKWRERDR